MEKIADAIVDLNESLNKRDLIAIMYNPDIPSGMLDIDVVWLAHIIQQSNFTYPTVLVYGHGGKISTAVCMTNLLKKKFNNYRLYVPLQCFSALTYLIFKANKLLITKDTQFTQIDPKIVYDDVEYRAIKNLNSSNPVLRNLCNDAFQFARKYVEELIKPESIIKYKYMNPGEWAHIDEIIKVFMNKESHFSEIGLRELDSIEVDYEISDDEDDLDKSKKLISESLRYMMDNNKRVMFVNSKSLVVPLN